MKPTWSNIEKYEFKNRSITYIPSQSNYQLKKQCLELQEQIDKLTRVNKTLTNKIEELEKEVSCRVFTLDIPIWIRIVRVIKKNFRA